MNAFFHHYTGKLGFACLGTWPSSPSSTDPPVYAIVDHRGPSWRATSWRFISAGSFPLRLLAAGRPPTANPDKYGDELLDAYLFVEDADALYAEYAAQGVEFARGLGNMPWHCRERDPSTRCARSGWLSSSDSQFVVKDCDGRLLAFGANL
jgi:hypothetical protein